VGLLTAEHQPNQIIGLQDFIAATQTSNDLKGVTTMAKFSPLHDRILVRRVEEATTTRGGIIIPDSAKDKPQEGEVVSTGNGRTNDEGKTFPLAVKEGDRILFGKYAGTEIKIDGEEFIIMKEDEVLGVLSGAPAKKELAGSKK
jgi:chaperonin GroES